MEGAAKKRKTAAETYSSMEKRLRELEDRIEKLEKKKPTAAATARKSTVASLDEKMNTILDILTKVVVPTAAAAGDSTQTQNYGKDTFLF